MTNPNTTGKDTRTSRGTKNNGTKTTPLMRNKPSAQTTSAQTTSAQAFASNTTLAEITTLAKTDRPSASKKLKTFAQKLFPNLTITEININSSSVSLNSVNGTLTTPNKKFFFKFHSEEEEEKSLISTEYYQSKQLLDAGLPLIQPLHASTKPGKQFLIYPLIQAPTAFKLWLEQDLAFQKTGKYDEALIEKLLKAEAQVLKKQSEIYLSTLKLTPSSEIKNAPINQLFFNRLSSQNNATPRLEIFYKNNSLILPGSKKEISFKNLSKLKWIINGQNYSKSLSEIIAQSQKLLNPLASPYQPTVLGHGDDHNGNKFFIDNQFKIFDPAFAGIQPALLSFVKATVHNVFLHPLWLYSPSEMSQLEVNYKVNESCVTIDHKWNLEEKSPLRLKILDLQVKLIWQPLLKALQTQNMLPKNWQQHLQSAFFCCPFLVSNLLDSKKYTPAQQLLALAKCIELAHYNFQKFMPSKT